MNHLLSIFILVFLSTPLAPTLAASNPFTVGVTITGSDPVPPTTPTLLTADPVSNSQIDLTWSAATDNVVVAGYSIFRGSTTIATTTLLSYSDNGLTASTTYQYAVRAFDGSFNYSTTSNTLATTTLNIIPPSAPATDSTGTAVRASMEDLNITEAETSVELELETFRPAKVEVRWGRTVDYELGYIVSDNETKYHNINITDLEPGTTYEYELIGYSKRGNGTVLSSGSFTTLAKELPTTPVNVNYFQASQVNDNVHLSWQMPTGDGIDFVRVVRSHLSFPTHPQDGAIIYQGSSEFVTDESVLASYSPVYYTAFVYDSNGNISSGAVAIVYDNSVFINDTQTKQGGGSEVLPIIDTPSVIEVATSSINKERVTVEMKMPDPSQIEITQGDKTYSLFDADITLDRGKNFIVSVPKKAVSGNLKSVIVTVLDPTNNKNAYSYLMRINKDQTAYQAVVPDYKVVGKSQIKVEIYDYEAFVVGTYQAPANFIVPVIIDYAKDVSDDDSFKIKTQPYVWLGIPLFFLVLILLFVYRRPS